MQVKNFRRAPHARAAALLAMALINHSFAMPAGALPQNGDYTLRPIVVGAGGTPMRGGNYALDGSVAQADAIVQNGAGSRRLDGGFWQAVSNPIISDRIFGNGFD